MQGDRFRRGVGQRGGPCALDPGGPEVDGRKVHFDPYLAHKRADRGLAIGACHRDHRRRLLSEPKRCRAGKGFAGGIGNDDGDT